MIDAGVHMGFPRRIAEQLVLQTIKGSASSIKARQDTPPHCASKSPLQAELSRGVVLFGKSRLPHRDFPRVGQHINAHWSWAGEARSR
ncbi:MAG: hypothetical protein IPJ47_22370 [Anaerolineales bacterium]|nr:hypothetical protein [Anaerolineales bacterium]